ncbi:MAG: hypothetical protein FJX76_04905 [Armatimonadetes bacterium]|nr:hypothetical protein [Armatimonadota bacterium]
MKSRWMMMAWLVVALSGAAHALPEALKKQLHKPSEYRMLQVKGNTPQTLVERLAANPANYKIVIWQAAPEVTRPEDAQRVMDWVAAGGTLWFQDSRLAPMFGMQAAPVSKADLRNVKDHKGEYGSFKKQAGAATFAMPPGGNRHPVLTGVDGVQIFVMKVGEDQYSAIQQTPEITPLLKIQLMSSQPLFDRLIAGLRPHGQGTVIFKPLIFDEQLTGARFQANLLEWSAGFGIPMVAPPIP